MIKRAANRRQVKVNKSVFLSDDFNEFWNKIKYKYNYQVDFDIEELIAKCIDNLNNHLHISHPYIKCIKSSLNFDNDSINVVKKDSTIYNINFEHDFPDIVAYLQNETGLTRRTIIRILKESDTLSLFEKNPQEYITNSSKIIKDIKNVFSVNGIKYLKSADYYSQDLFKNEEQFGYLERNIMEVKRSVYDYIIYDSEIEKKFALYLEYDADVKLYFKFPKWFKIPTPLGNYNPDWGILFEFNDKKFYCIVETIRTQNIKQKMDLKLDCAKMYFNYLDEPMPFFVTDSYPSFKKNIHDNYLNDEIDLSELKNYLINTIEEYLNLNQFEEALFLTDNFIKSYSFNELCKYKAICLQNLRRFEEALEIYELTNDNINKGNLLMGLNRFKEAVDCYEEYLIWSDLDSHQNNMFNHIVNQKGNSGFYSVSRVNHYKYNWVYTYMKNDEFKQIYAVNIKELRRKVYDNNLIWAVLDKDLAMESRRKDLTRGNQND